MCEQDWFAQMGEEMQRAEDEEAAAAFRLEVEKREKETGMVCVMLESVDDDDDDDDDDDEEEEEEEEVGEEATEEEEDEQKDEEDPEDEEDGSDSDEDWAPDGMKERLERALKAFVQPAVAQALEAAQMGLGLAAMLPGAASGAVEKLVAAAEGAADGSEEEFATAFGVTIAMGALDAEESWAADREVAQALLTRLGSVWQRMLGGGGKRKGKAETSAIGALDENSHGDIVKKLAQLAEEWAEKPLGLKFVFEADGNKRAKKE